MGCVEVGREEVTCWEVVGCVGGDMLGEIESDWVREGTICYNSDIPF